MTMANKSFSKFESSNVTSAVSIANAAPAPMATPTSATARAGASLTPSPTIMVSWRLLQGLLTTESRPVVPLKSST